MAEVVNPLLDFSSQCPGWLQDLIRRVYSQAEMREEDLAAVRGFLLAEHSAELPPTELPAPLLPEHLPPTQTESAPVTLDSVEGISAVNRLAADQTLRFASTGLTVVYGDNGSGKSGYVRLLKRLCRVRTGAAENLLGDVFARPATSARATVRFTVADGTSRAVPWVDGTPAPIELSRISVFDSRAMVLYADQQNQLEFLPYHLDVLPRVATAMGALATGIDHEVERSLAGLPPDWSAECPGTSTQALLLRLKPESTDPDAPPSEASLEAAATWTSTDDDSLQMGERTLLEGGPEVVARRRRDAERLRTVVRDIELVAARLDDPQIEVVRSTVEQARVARAAATLAADRGFAGEPLDAVGSDPWRLMFEYARQYSALAYPGQPFPVVSAGSRCPLCQQVLDAEARDRLARFAEFVQAATAAAADEREAAVAALATEYVSLVVPEFERAQQVVADTTSADALREAILATTAAYLSQLGARHEAIIALIRGDTVAPVPPLLSSPVEELTARAAALEVEADAIADIADPARRAVLEANVRELRARQLLNERLAETLSRRKKVVRVRALRAARRACDTTPVSRAATELRRQFITADYAARLRRDLDAVGLEYLPFRVIDQTDHGVSYVRIVLDAPAAPRNREVLSDGEYRALALACFLAEIGDVPGHSGIVVDDPVSSLDHTRADRVAKRLTAEAASGRQVVVFTHDLVFYQALRSAAAKAHVPMAGHWLRRAASGQAGVVSDGDLPWQLKRVRERIGALRPQLAALKRSTDQGGDEYRLLAIGFYTGLRETWERLVEELLFNDVIGRFQLSVSTLQLRGAAVENGDHAKVFFAMDRVSTFSGHDRPIGRQAGVPTPEEAERDLLEIETYSDELRARVAALVTQRKALETPPAPKFT